MAAPSAGVASARTGGPVELRGWLRSVGRAGAERWIWPVSAMGWAVLVWAAVGWYPLGASVPALHDHAGMTHPAADAGAGAVLAGHLLLWAAMVAATMLPLIARNLRTVGRRSPRGRRVRATLEVASGWALVWLAAGVAVAAALVAAASAPHALVVGIACAAAIGWQFTRARRVALARCHRAFAPPLGSRAASANRRFGLTLGRDCLLACGASMILMAAAGHRLPVVVALGWLAWRDMRRPHDSPGAALAVAVLVAVGVFSAAVQP